MTWIYFNEHDRMTPMRDCALESLAGRQNLRDFHGKNNLVLFFSHGEDCAACNEVVQELSAHSLDFAENDAELLVILPEQGFERLRSVNQRVHFLVDHGGAAKRLSVEDLYNAGEESAVLYVLDRYQAPYAALVEDELPTKNLYPEISAWLDYIQIQCPE